MTQGFNICKDPLVNWNAGKLLPAPRRKRPRQRERFYPVHCANPDCNNIRWLTKSAAERAEAEQRMCRKCQTIQAGKKGFAVTAARYGADFALRAVQRHQIANPSRHEQIVAEWLTEFNANFQRQADFAETDEGGVRHCFILDFLVSTLQGKQIVLEVNGYFHNRYRAERDYWLECLYPGDVIFINTDDIDKDPEQVRTAIHYAIQQKQ